MSEAVIFLIPWDRLAAAEHLPRCSFVDRLGERHAWSTPNIILGLNVLIVLHKLHVKSRSLRTDVIGALFKSDNSSAANTQTLTDNKVTVGVGCVCYLQIAVGLRFPSRKLQYHSVASLNLAGVLALANHPTGTHGHPCSSHEGND